MACNPPFQLCVCFFFSTAPTTASKKTKGKCKTRCPCPFLSPSPLLSRQKRRRPRAVRTDDVRQSSSGSRLEIVRIPDLFGSQQFLRVWFSATLFETQFLELFTFFKYVFVIVLLSEKKQHALSATNPRAVSFAFPPPLRPH